tara:strand:- start:873 stop:1430 length:558 start_codon:yes stop_codon:yes gene_type:complete
MVGDMSHMESGTGAMLTSTTEMTDDLNEASGLTGIMLENVKDALKAWERRGTYVPGTPSTGGGGGIMTMSEMIKTGTSLESYAASVGIKIPTPGPTMNHPRFKQHGGMINEPIWGIGSSGQTYMFGEAGPERIIPTGASTRGGGGIGPVTINVNVDSINNDVDLEKIKPVIERALHEVHARWGII